MAKAKKTEAADGGATKKQATETKKAAPAKRHSPPPKATKTAPSTTKAAAATEKPSAAGGAATRKKASAKPGGGTPAGGGRPLIDTSLAAHAAASFISNRSLLGTSPPAPQSAVGDDAPDDSKPGEKRETSTFKQLKAGLNKPAGQGFGGLLGGNVVGKKGNTGFGSGNQQTGRNQTFGADVNRSSVPRRTGG